MDRPDTAPQGSTSTPGASSAAAEPTGTTQALGPQSVSALGTSSAPGPSSDAPASPDSESGTPRATTSQQPAHPTQTTTTLYHGSPVEQSPSTEVPTSQQPARAAPPLRIPEPTPGPSASAAVRPRTTSTLAGGSSYEPHLSVPNPPPVPGHYRSLEFATGPGARPTTGSTLGGPGSESQHPSALGHPEALHRASVRGINQPLPPMPVPARMAENGFTPRRQRPVDGPLARRSGISGIDWPADEKRPRTVSERLEPTIFNAEAECAKYKTRARLTGWALNFAIGLQVLLGSITTGLSAVGTTGKNTSIQTTILGALSTLAASYLARARGSGEPEVSNTRVRDLEQFIRDAKAFELDHGHLDGSQWDGKIEHLRKRFEELLGNVTETRGQEGQGQGQKTSAENREREGHPQKKAESPV